jgi:hypothetical protein
MTGMIQYFAVKSVSTEDADFSQNLVLLLPSILILNIFFQQHTINTCAYIHLQYISFLYVQLYMYLDSFEFPFTLHTYWNFSKRVFCVIDTSSESNGQCFVKFRTWFLS